MHIVQATRYDIPRLVEIENIIFEEDDFALKRENFSYHVRENFIYTAKYNSEIFGYILVLNKYKVPRLYSLAVLPEHRRNGIASQLLEFALARLGHMRLEVKTTNFKAIRLYEKFGFKRVKLLKNYYKTADGIEMLRQKF